MPLNAPALYYSTLLTYTGVIGRIKIIKVIDMHLSSIVLAHVILHFFLEKSVKLRVFYDFLLPRRTFKIFIHLYDIFEIIKGEFPCTHVNDELR